MPLMINVVGNALTFSLKVQAGAKKNALAGTWENALKVKIAKKPEQGAANRACVVFLAKVLDVAQNQISIIHGEFSHLKVIRVEGITEAAARQKLLP